MKKIQNLIIIKKKYINAKYKNIKVQKENIEIKFNYTIIKNENKKKNNYIKK